MENLNASDPFHPDNMPVAPQTASKTQVVRIPDSNELDNLITDNNAPAPQLAEAENATKYGEGRWEPDVLKPRHREILRRVFEGSSYQDIADAMGIHKQTVMLVATSKLFREELAKMESRADYTIVSRADSMANEALDKIKTLMRSSRSEFLQKQCAERILDTAGYSKVERKILGIVTGEDVIRELNKRKREATSIAGDGGGPALPEIDLGDGSDILP
jgi:hypothetical protein